MGIGNLFQLAMWAHDGAASGQRRWILATPKLVPWLDVFPGMRSLVLTPEEVRFTDRRVRPWSEASRSAGHDMAVPLHEQVDMLSVEAFIREILLPESTLESIAGVIDPGIVVVNVRRGDYYSDPEIRLHYGFDVGAYVLAAVSAEVAREGTPSSFLVVSDDIEWCTRELAWLTAIAPTDFARTSGPVADFALISSARRLIISNSTFSYWAAHVGNVVHEDNHEQVWAPRFFDRSQNEGRSWLLDERWSVIEELPCGWGLGAVDEEPLSIGEGIERGDR